MQNSRKRIDRFRILIRASILFGSLHLRILRIGWIDPLTYKSSDQIFINADVHTFLLYIWFLYYVSMAVLFLASCKFNPRIIQGKMDRNKGVKYAAAYSAQVLRGGGLETLAREGERKIDVRLSK